MNRLSPAITTKTSEEHDEQGGLRFDHPPEHVIATERVVPQVVDVEPSDRPTEDEDEQEESAEPDQDAHGR